MKLSVTPPPFALRAKNKRNRTGSETPYTKYIEEALKRTLLERGLAKYIEADLTGKTIIRYDLCPQIAEIKEALETELRQALNEFLERLL